MNDLLYRQEQAQQLENRIEPDVIERREDEPERTLDVELAELGERFPKVAALLSSQSKWHRDI